MQRFYVDGMKLYYPSEDAVRTAYPDAESVYQIDDKDHLPYINDIFQRCHMVADGIVGTDHRFVLTTETSFGVCEIMLSRDPADEHFYDYARYRLHRSGRLIEPVCWNVSNPREVCYKFLIGPSTYEVLSRGGKLRKPAELKGVKHIATAMFSKASCQIFIKGWDMYIKHTDYFSPSYRRDEDLGTPLEYRCRKYGVSERGNKFVYPDCWGDIVQRRNAWVKVSNFIPMLYNLDDVKCGRRLYEMLSDYHHFRDVDPEWERFFERVAKQSRCCLNKT